MYMYSSKAQWFLIAAAITITMLVAIYNINIKKIQTEAMYSFEREKTILEKLEFLVSKILADSFENNRTELIKNIISAFDVSVVLAKVYGMKAEVFCLCEYKNQTSNILVMSFFNSTLDYSISSQNSISGTISKLKINSHNLTIKNNVTIELDLGEGAICAYHYYKTNFCACIILLTDGKNIFVGKTLNLNWC